ncbi:complex I subunit 5 family protein [Salinarimonas sp.]|uniref:complex I subunit 5 family protein n=1 Tax=Salinarimonas sp. TaxID=2766526 RepID=UPI00391D986A
MSFLAGFPSSDADWLALTLVIPLVGAAIAFLVPRRATLAGLASLAATGACVAVLAARVMAQESIATTLGGPAAPIGIGLRVDGLSVVMLAMAVLVVLVAGLGAIDAFGRRRAGAEGERALRAFWPLALTLLAGLCGIYVATDLFSLYVLVELVGLASVGLAVLGGRLEAMRAGFEYLTTSMLGALFFLMGVAFVWLQAGRLDFEGVAAHAGEPAMLAAFALMLIGLSLKAALFPVSFWLPRTHARASAPASALLSALVHKASLYILLRLWIEIFTPSDAIGLLLGLMGTGAIVWGSINALRAERLKLLVAWSTVSQMGLMCVAFALADTTGAALAWQGAVLLILAHAMAKAAMFLAAGRIAAEVGHDRIAELDRSAVRPTLAQFAFALAAVSLVGLPPSAGFAGKWLLIEGAVRADAWLFVAIAGASTALSIAYLGRVLPGFLRSDRQEAGGREYQGWALADAPPLALALLAAVSGLLAYHVLALVTLGAPFGG